jgi:uncharacterized Tic20 family protein
MSKQNKDSLSYKLGVIAGAIISAIVIFGGLLLVGFIADHYSGGNILIGALVIFVCVEALGYTLGRFVKFVGTVAIKKHKGAK